MNQYTFTDEQLFELLQGAVGMYQEQVRVHGKEPGQAVAAAANESIEGLLAERELFDHGELRAEQLTQVYPLQATEHIVKQAIGTIEAGSRVTGMIIGSLG